MLAVVVAEGVAIALLAVLVLGLLRSHALILRALHELGAGLELEEAAAANTPPGPVPVRLEPGVVPASRAATSRATDIVGTTLDGTPARVEVTGEGRRTLLAFLSSGCSVCRGFWAQLSSGGVDVPGQARLAVVTQGPQEESVTRLRQLAGPRLEVVGSSEAWSDYGVPGSPYFVYVEDGVVTGEGSSTTWAQVRDLMGQAVDDTAAARRAPARDDGRPAGRDNNDRDDPASVDRELLGAGIHPGHPSLYQPPETEPAAVAADPAAVAADPEAVAAVAADAERSRR